MKRYSTAKLQIRALGLILLLIVVAVSLTGFITQKPQALWKRITYITQPPPPTPLASQRFTTLPSGATLPSEKECAARVRRSSWEPRPDSSTANQKVPTAQQISAMAPWGPSIGVD